MKYVRGTIASLFLLAAGCAGTGSAMTSAPADWADYEGHDVTLRGSAGNSGQGPIVRFADGGYIALLQRPPWEPAVVGRPIKVRGTVISGKGVRAEKYILDMKSAEVVPPEEDTPADDAKAQQ